jgi:hypothetical protein
MITELREAREASSACSLCRWERGGVRGFALSLRRNPLTPTLSPAGRGSSPSSRQPFSLMLAMRELREAREASSACSLCRWERGGVRGFALSLRRNPLTPTRIVAEADQRTRFPLPLWERVVRAEGEDPVRGFALMRLQVTPHPARRSLTLATSHPLPQGERESAFAARFRNNPTKEEVFKKIHSASARRSAASSMSSRSQR